MSTGYDSKQARRRLGLACVALLGAVACHGDVENLTAPDRERATANPNDVQAFIGGAFFPTFHNAINTSLAINTFAFGSAQWTATLAGSQDQQQYEEIMEPRRIHNNAPHISQSVGPHGPRNYWAAIGRAQSIAYDGLQILDDGMVIMEGTVNVTPRARAFAKFMQGWSWGYAALVFDKSHVVPETLVMPAEPSAVIEVAVSTLTSYEDALTNALRALDEAIQIARANPAVVNYPAYPGSQLWFGSPTPISNDQFIRMANTLAARLLVLNARTPAERARVNWQRVLSYTANGVTQDFAMQLATNRTSTLLLRIQRNTTTGTDNARWNYRTIGLADQSGAYQRWIAAPVAERVRFNIVTPDRRITGLTPTSNGSYTTYRADDNGFLQHRGTSLFSAYQWTRHMFRNNLTGTNTGNNTGVHPLITADENNLLRAEALLRTGDLAGAATLINITRTRTQRVGTTDQPGLPPVTTTGAPTVNGACVPRTDSGACGDLLTALRYERFVELAGIDMIIPRADSRGFGVLSEGSLYQWPVPGNVLELYHLPEYTYGGVGMPGGAVYAPATLP
jgi:hypothetical protein